MNAPNIQSLTYIQAGNKNKALLMLHGFNSSKEEVKGYFKTLGAELEEIGISSFSPDLFHQRDQLLSLREQYEIVRESIQFLIQSGFKEIAVCGFSLGSYLIWLTFGRQLAFGNCQRSCRLKFLNYPDTKIINTSFILDHISKSNIPTDPLGVLVE